MNVYASGFLFGIITFSSAGITFVALTSKPFNYRASWILVLCWVVTLLLGWLFFYLKHEAEQIQQRRLKELGKLDFKDRFDPVKSAQWNARFLAITSELDSGTRRLSDDEINQIADHVFLPPLLLSSTPSFQFKIDDDTDSKPTQIFNQKSPNNQR
jgi:hypothetical protein